MVKVPEHLKKLEDIIPVPTAHGTGSKFVFRSNNEMEHASTQVAYGKFLPGEICKEHIHPTMFEYFYFIKGEGTYIIDGVEFHIEPDTFLEIPAGLSHSLHANKNEELNFVYWGVATANSE